MATPAQILANQTNAQRSTGPVTAEGKARVSRNATKLGLFSSSNFVPAEERGAFDILRETFDRAGIRYAIGGSWASTAFGQPRFTNGVDILADLTPHSLDVFLNLLPTGFYADRDEALRALAAGRSFNIIHAGTVLKFDLFPASAFPLGIEELDRAITLDNSGLSDGPAGFVSPEDILFAKLHWFRAGGRRKTAQTSLPRRLN